MKAFYSRKSKLGRIDRVDMKTTPGELAAAFVDASSAILRPDSSGASRRSDLGKIATPAGAKTAREPEGTLHRERSRLRY